MIMINYLLDSVQLDYSSLSAEQIWNTYEDKRS